MNVRWPVHALVLLGVISSLIYLIKMYSSIDGMMLFISIWILIPYYFLARFNETWQSRFKRPVIFLFTVILLLSVSVYLLLDIAVLHPDPLGGVVMLFWPPIQLACIVVALEFCKR